MSFLYPELKPYIILIANNDDTLEAFVKARIEQGYVPQGGVFVPILLGTSPRFIQAMILKTVIHNPNHDNQNKTHRCNHSQVSPCSDISELND